ncbi:transcription elongation factor subunit Spt4 [Hyperthermus butylicus]|uniref:Transcription elongation factor Spt4 n=1 Tax=Hyperthermus butylicus (strain DSM 5456 / JCM 9403 / PLM1-5) TaxID=415426 RepID=A2BJZ3_HYPBU|nr:transcription elongation factor subunit Spt4 [Hyperthermus butylicus]ABM80304.1 DNA-directed RNA polymerase subunit E'' [Hyperthermus butylicus DSM 5456]
MGRRVKVPPFKACRRCKSLVPREATRCSVCGSTDLTEDWEGVVIILDPEKSLIAKKLEITRPGRYALKVR